MFKKFIIIVVALWVIGSLLGGEDEEPVAGDSGGGLMADAGAEEMTPSPRPNPTKTPAPAKATSTHAAPAKNAVATYLVTRVVDGDTIELGNGESVRLVGIDTPERGQCGYDEATANLERLVLGERVRLGMSDEDRDKYDRLLRYVNVGRKDAGLQQINRGLAIARYDSRDGYGYHPRESRYIAADKATADLQCASKPKPQPMAQVPANNCAEGYSPCIPPYPPDVDCSDVNGPIYVTGSDPHGLDADGDGVACE